LSHRTPPRSDPCGLWKSTTSDASASLKSQALDAAIRCTAHIAPGAPLPLARTGRPRAHSDCGGFHQSSMTCPDLA
jgi:hypothetical protein